MEAIKALEVQKIKALGLGNISSLNSYRFFLEKKGKYNYVSSRFPNLDLDKIFIIEYSRVFNKTKNE